MLISDEYRRQNAWLHILKASYGTGGKQWAEKVRNLMDRYQTVDVLDYGCGKGTLRQALGINVKEYDPAVPGKEERPRPADLVVCTDVLEHIEPECLDEVLDDIQSLTRRAAFFTVCTRPAQKQLPDGRNAHLIVEPPRWWISRIKPRFHIVEVDLKSKDDVVALTCEPKEKV